MRNPAPDSSLCRAAPRLRPLQLLLPGPIAASASTAAPRLPPLPAAAPRLCPLQLLLATCVCFSCCSRSRPIRLLVPDCVRFSCCSLIVPCVRPPHSNLIQFSCYSPIASALVTAFRLHQLAPPAILEGSNPCRHSSLSMRFRGHSEVTTKVTYH